ncbi:recombination protein RecR [Candidatus Wolfebacteria bacterium]|nr:MAG: recombination protein RecR [Candidatus Wolfebacteria bacterium]
MDPLVRLAKFFSEFPGIGERQSKRFVYFLIRKNPEYINELSALISTIKNTVHQCTSCFRFFPIVNNASQKEIICEACSSPNTDRGLLMIVEKDADYESITQSNMYSGHFFILGGLMPIIEKNTSQFVRSKELIAKVKKLITENKLEEIILAFSLNPQGENTDTYIRKLLAPLLENTSITISTLGRGLSTGTELEYSDDDTIRNALKNRS